MRRAAAFLALLCVAACASGGGVNLATRDRLVAAMDRLGASGARGECIAAGVDRRLDDADDEEAARLAERALSRDDMREGVLGANERVRQAFIGANLGCSLAG